MKPGVFKVGDLVLERPTEFGMVCTAGPKTFDVVFISGFVSRHRQGQSAYVFERVVGSSSFSGSAEYEARVRANLTKEVQAVRDERARGAGIRRGAIHPSR